MIDRVMSNVHRILKATTSGTYPIVLTPPIKQTPPTTDWKELDGPLSPPTLDRLAASQNWDKDPPIDDFWVLRDGVWVRRTTSPYDNTGFNTGINPAKPATDPGEQPLTMGQRALRALAMRVDALHANIYSGDRARLSDVARFIGHGILFTVASSLLKTGRDTTPRTA